MGILESYQNTLPEADRSGFDYSETLLYRNMLLEETGNLDAALAHLKEIESGVVDKLAILEKRAQLLHDLGRFDEAEAVLRTLLRVNPDNLRVHHSLIGARLHVDPATASSVLVSASPDDAGIRGLVQLYGELKSEFPKCIAVRRIPLDFLHGEEFHHHLESYLRPDLRKGVPSLFINLKSLYADPRKRPILEEVIRGSFESITTKETFPNSEEKVIL